MAGRRLLQYLIDTSDMVLAKKQEATEYLAKVEKAAQQARALDGLYCQFCGEPLSEHLVTERGGHCQPAHQ